MTREFAAASLAAFLSLGIASPGFATSPDSDAAPLSVEQASASADLPFTRQLGASGIVTGSLSDSTAIAGVPPAAMAEALRALGTAIDLERDIKNGDRFHVRYEQTFTLEGQPVGAAHVLWVELRTAARGTVAVHRFRMRDGVEQFWLAGGKAAAPPTIRQPLDIMTLTSGFGWRADPLDHPPGPLANLPQPVAPAAPPAAAAQPSPEETAAAARDRREIARAYAGFGSGGQLGSTRGALDPGHNAELDRIMAERRIRARREKEDAARRTQEAAAKAAALVAVAAPPRPPPRKLFMHEGLDLLANIGTPVHAAADGTVIGAGPNGHYGNWIRIKHAGHLTTVYGHLSAFAAGIEAGATVAQGELIGFVGNTGRSTGAHLHFELLIDGRPVDPRTHPAMRPGQLAGADLGRFRMQVAASLVERDREAAEMNVSFARLPTTDLRSDAF